NRERIHALQSRPNLRSPSAIMEGGPYLMDELYLEGDPATDSTRRHLERVLAAHDRPRRGPWITAAVAGAAALGVWQWRRNRRPSRPVEPAASSPRK